MHFLDDYLTEESGPICPMCWMIFGCMFFLAIIGVVAGAISCE